MASVDTDRCAWDELGEPAPPPALSPLDGDVTADVCVVGLGASGLAAARHLAARGADVVAVDGDGIAAGAAGRNGGFLLAGAAQFHHDAVAAWGRDLAVRLYRATLVELDRTVDELGPAARPVGSLRVAADPAEAADIVQQLEALRADGFPGQAYLGLEGTGILVPGDAAFHPVVRARTLAHEAVAAGARLAAPVWVRELEPGRVVTDTATVRAPRTVVAVDGGLESLLPELAGRVRTTRLQMLATAPDRGISLPHPVYRRWGYDYVQQLPTGEVLLGGCRDAAIEDEWGAPAEPTPLVQRCLDRELARLGVHAPVTHRWAGRSAWTDDLLPVCEEVRPGVYAVGGYSGHGNLLGTICARAAAEVALDGGTLDLHRALATG